MEFNKKRNVYYFWVFFFGNRGGVGWGVGVLLIFKHYFRSFFCECAFFFSFVALPILNDYANWLLLWMCVEGMVPQQTNMNGWADKMIKTFGFVYCSQLRMNICIYNILDCHLAECWHLVEGDGLGWMAGLWKPFECLNICGTRVESTVRANNIQIAVSVMFYHFYYFHRWSFHFVPFFCWLKQKVSENGQRL